MNGIDIKKLAQQMSVEEFRSNTKQILKHLNHNRNTIYLTENGTEVAIVIPRAIYEETQKQNEH